MRWRRVDFGGSGHHEAVDSPFNLHTRGPLCGFWEQRPIVVHQIVVWIGHEEHQPMGGALDLIRRRGDHLYQKQRRSCSPPGNWPRRQVCRLRYAGFRWSWVLLSVGALHGGPRRRSLRTHGIFHPLRWQLKRKHKTRGVWSCRSSYTCPIRTSF
ncbi:hypothetical protein BRADI_5g10093v3 [Brachypodium distachyon]|uniref:Uncharacterized protein n=1 Tax=Brachypodium distachyon TaxID=15368 RepID=A0A0Q3E4K0_BRADI|nr:hypothetical protein BRADI_5g10093v3 [Brachypodium distachyon]KQJ82623.1 hypothetical protein BRADI_5g10093v3 [Brachypodium distachyon]